MTSLDPEETAENTEKIWTEHKTEPRFANFVTQLFDLRAGCVNILTHPTIIPALVMSIHSFGTVSSSLHLIFK